MLYGLVLTLFLAFGSFTESDWLNWKEEQYKEPLQAKTSFLNATQLTFTTKGKVLYLVEGSRRDQTHWQQDEPTNWAAKAEHLSDKVKLTIKGEAPVFLTASQRRRDFLLKNGAIAEAVLGKRVGKLWGYVYDPDQIKKFTGFRFYPFNPQAIIKGVYTQRGRQVVSYKTVQGDLTEVAKVGEVKFEWEGKSYALNAYNWQKPGEPLEYIALIFVEPTAGQETYAGGRELVIDITNGKVKKQFVTLDFNRTTNFYCAHSPFWHCPTGLQQKLDVATKAGEMLPLKKIVSRKAL